jgi:hypothetical protein
MPTDPLVHFPARNLQKTNLRPIEDLSLGRAIRGSIPYYIEAYNQRVACAQSDSTTEQLRCNESAER